jgi:glutamate dehydrogenase/leucine dehydrogenase
MLPNIDEAEMRGLARAMTYKYGFLGLPQGGAKSGVFIAPNATHEERLRRLAEFGLALAPLLRSRLYVPGTDMGTCNDDILHLLRAAGAHSHSRDLRGCMSGYYTDLTVFVGVKEASRHLGMTLDGCSAAIEGFGKVGSELALLLDDAGVRVVAVSTSNGAIYNPRGLDVRLLRKIAAEAGSRVVEQYDDAEKIGLADLFELPVDILCPCARHESLHAGNAPRVLSRIVCPGANNPVTPDAERILYGRGVLCLPDFVTNSGGVLGGTMEFASVPRRRIEAFTDRHIGARIADILMEAEKQGVTPRDIAGPLALRRFAQVKHNADHSTPLRRLFNRGLELYHRGLIPASLVSKLALPYFERVVGNWADSGKAP